MKDLLTAVLIMAVPSGVLGVYYRYLTPAHGPVATVAASESADSLSRLRGIVTRAKAEAASGDTGALARRLMEFDASWSTSTSMLRVLDDRARSDVDDARDAIKSVMNDSDHAPEAIDGSLSALETALAAAAPGTQPFRSIDRATPP